MAQHFTFSRHLVMNTDLTAYNFKTLIPIRFADIDAFGHVNNAIYLTYFEIARAKYLKEIIHWDWDIVGIIIGRAEIDFLRPVKMSDELYAYVRTARTGNSSFDLEYLLAVKTTEGELTCTVGSTVCVTYNYDENRASPIPEYQLDKMVGFEMLSSLK